MYKKYYKIDHRKAFYDEQFALQKGRCAICGRPERLVVDHDHKSGFMRGLLCYKHNSALGLFEDDVTFLDRAKEYLQVFEVRLGTIKKKRVDSQKVINYIKETLESLMADTTFPSDRARARVLAQKTGLLETTAHTKVRRARYKLLALDKN